jgi:hypothetical protein
MMIKKIFVLLVLLLSVSCNRTFLESSNLSSEKGVYSKIDQNIVVIAPMITLDSMIGNYQDCTSSISLKDEGVYAHSTVISKVWEIMDMGGASSYGPPTPGTSTCTTDFISSVYSGSGSRSGSGDRFTISDIQRGNVFLITLTVTDDQGHVAKAQTIFGSTEKDDFENGQGGNQLGILIAGLKPAGFIASEGKIQILKPTIDLQISENGSSEFSSDVMSLDRSGVDWDNDGTYEVENPYSSFTTLETTYSSGQLIHASFSVASKSSFKNGSIIAYPLGLFKSEFIVDVK